MITHLKVVLQHNYRPFFTIASYKKLFTNFVKSLKPLKVIISIYRTDTCWALANLNKIHESFYIIILETGFSFDTFPNSNSLESLS